MRPYTELPGFGDVVLEESYVLGICASPMTLRIDLDMVLTPRHPAYVSPPAFENECYRRVQIRFVELRRLIWDHSGLQAATDVNGAVDYGHLDDLRWDGEIFELEGDWGRIRAVARRVEINVSQVE